ncbi:hypothetical protein CFP56_009546 [Quercus suber]|uniref:Uncharacterized protein n=1 Tax=Quercus suber TaxID=58331 RepID=A0AAW0M609_QUESU
MYIVSELCCWSIYVIERMWTGKFLKKKLFLKNVHIIALRLISQAN